MSEAQGFNAKVAAGLVSLTYRQLIHWDETGLIKPSIRASRGPCVRCARVGSQSRQRKPPRPDRRGDGHALDPVHKGRTMKLGTIRGLLKAAGLTEEQFLAAYRGK